MSRIPLAAVIALVASPAIAWAQDRILAPMPEPTLRESVERPLELVPSAPVEDLGDAVSWTATLVRRIAERQRFGPRGTLIEPPLVSPPGASPWVPDIRSVPPPGELVRPIAAAPVELTPVLTSSANRQVASARGPDAIFVGLQLRSPFLIP